MTKLLICLILIKVVSWGSKPTVWDGDECDIGTSMSNFNSSSKPTVWDGDFFGEGAKLTKECDIGSKPTVWDVKTGNLV